MAQDLVKYLYDKIFDNYNGLFTCYDIILYAKDRTLYTKNDITRDLGKLTTKVLFEKNIYGFGNVSKAYVIPKQYIDKNTNLAAYNDRWSYNYNFTNKYKTNDERI
jgi:putative transposon-encoded protein